MNESHINSVPRVPDDELEYDEDLLYLYRGIPFTGIGFDEDPGSGLSEIMYKDGRQRGFARDWYPSGSLRAEANFVNNVLHGRSREFREDGSVESDEYFDHGVLVESDQFNDKNRASRGS